MTENEKSAVTSNFSSWFSGTPLEGILSNQIIDNYIFNIGMLAIIIWLASDISRSIYFSIFSKTYIDVEVISNNNIIASKPKKQKNIKYISSLYYPSVDTTLVFIIFKSPIKKIHESFISKDNNEVPFYEFKNESSDCIILAVGGVSKYQGRKYRIEIN